MARHTTFQWVADPTAVQARVLARHEGAARFAFNQGLRLHLDARNAANTTADGAVKIPWSGFDLINAFNAWKKTEDAGRRFVVALAGGTETLRITESPKALRTAQPVTRRLQKSVSRKVKGSANRRAAVRRLARHHERVRARRHHFLHQVSNVLVKTHDRLVIEDLNIQGMLTNHRLAAAISDAAWGELARQLRYKQTWRGGHVLTADRWLPSSKTCSACGDVKLALTLTMRVINCDTCGHTIDRDLNAAINLATWAEQHHAQVLDPEARGQVTNAHRPEGSGRRSRADETSRDDVGTLTATAA